MDTEVNFYLQQFGINNAVVARITHDAAMVAAVYKIERQHGEPLILKIFDPPRHYHRERAALERFAGVVPVPRLQYVIPPDDHIRGAMFMEYIPGCLLSEQGVTEDLAYELGYLLARVHNVRSVGNSDLLMQQFVQTYEENLAECEGHLPMDIIRACRTYYATHLHLLRHVDASCIVHRDFHPGNIIVNNGAVAGIIDWSSSRDGCAEEDLCSLENSSWNLTITTKETFLKGYGSVRTVPDYRALIPLFQLNKRLAVIGFTIRTGIWKTRGAAAYQHCCQRIEQFFVDVAY